MAIAVVAMIVIRRDHLNGLTRWREVYKATRLHRTGFVHRAVAIGKEMVGLTHFSEGPFK